MVYRGLFFCSGILVVCFVSVAFTDETVCRRVGESMRNVCYQYSVYSRCKQTCKNLILADSGNKKYKNSLCPWGNYYNIQKSDLDPWCENKIRGNCNRYCINPNHADLKDGQNCCKACIDLCQKAPARDSTFKAEFPEIYS